MSLRRRLAITVAAAVALALAVVAVVAYLVTRSELRGQVDDRLREQVGMIPHWAGTTPECLPATATDGGGPGGPSQFELPLTDDPDVGPPFAVRVVDGPDGDLLIDRGDLAEVEPLLDSEDGRAGLRGHRVRRGARPGALGAASGRRVDRARTLARTRR